MNRSLGYSKGASSAAIVLILIVIVAAVFFLSPSLFSGLSGGQNIGTGLVGPGAQGLVISQFSPSTNTLQVGGIPIVYTIIVKNLGEEPATNIKTTIIGGLGSGTSPNPALPTMLTAASQSQNIIGGQASSTWVITAPNSGSADQTYVSTARLTYTYSTVSTSLIRVATQDYLQSITTPGQQEPLNQFGLVSSVSTMGPFQISATVPVSVLSNPSGESTVLVQYQITNVGGGRTFSGSAPTTTTLDQVSTTTTATSDSGTVTVSGCTNTNPPLTLNAGNSLLLTCTLSVSGVASYAQISLSLTLNYNYFVDSTTSIKVLKALPGSS